MDWCKEYLGDAVEWVKNNEDIYLVVNGGNVSPDEVNVIEGSGYVILEIVLNNTQSYDGQYLQGVKVGSLSYDLSDVEIEGGYVYNMRIKYQVQSCSVDNGC